jgi:hypothetical protein
MQRHDLYGPIHKGIRLALSDLLVRLGNADFSDEAEAGELLGAVRRQLLLSAGHLHHEEVEIHGALESRAPGATLTLQADHDHHRRAFETLEAAIAAVEAAPAAARAAPARQLYLAFSQFAAADFAHMAEEELVVLPLLHRLFDDAELIAMEGRIVAAIPPEKMIDYLKLMIPGMNPAERATFLAFVRAGAPPEMFDAILGFAARPTLAPAAYEALELALAA